MAGLPARRGNRLPERRAGGLGSRTVTVVRRRPGRGGLVNLEDPPRRWRQRRQRPSPPVSLYSLGMSRDRDPASTAVLVRRFGDGDLEARDTLVERYLPLLRRWAHGRLPRYARSNAETDDLVQVTLLRALDNLASFEVRHEGAFLAYLRRIFLNMVRDEIRRYGRGPGFEELGPAVGDDAPSAVEEILGKEKLARYEAALAELPEMHREAVILRVEFGMSYDEIAHALERPSANAARMTVARALERLAKRLE